MVITNDQIEKAILALADGECDECMNLKVISDNELMRVAILNMIADNMPLALLSPLIQKQAQILSLHAISIGVTLAEEIIKAHWNKEFTH